MHRKPPLIAMLIGMALTQLSGSSASAQTPVPDSLRAVRYRNAFVFEILGNAGFYSFNYQRTLHHWKGVSLLGRAGASYIPSRTHSVPIPTELLVVIGAKRSKAEVGIGVVHTVDLWAGADLSRPGSYSATPTARLGYRRDRDDRNFFTLNVMTFSVRRPFPWVGIGLGKYFRNKRQVNPTP